MEHEVKFKTDHDFVALKHAKPPFGSAALSVNSEKAYQDQSQAKTSTHSHTSAASYITQ